MGSAGWANGFIVNPTLTHDNIGLQKAHSLRDYFIRCYTLCCKSNLSQEA